MMPQDAEDEPEDLLEALSKVITDIRTPHTQGILDLIDAVLEDADEKEGKEGKKEDSGDGDSGDSGIGGS